MTISGLLLLLQAPLSLGCGGATADQLHPSDVLVAYQRAVASGDANAAYALLDEPTQAHVSSERVAELLSQNQAELTEQATAITTAGAESTPLAHMRLENGETVSLVLEDGRWRVDGGVLAATSLRTPQDAVRALRLALSRRSLAGVERVLAREPRTQMQADIRRILDETEDELDLEIDIRGNRAHVRTTEGRNIILVRESGEWRVLTIQ